MVCCQVGLPATTIFDAMFSLTISADPPMHVVCPCCCGRCGEAEATRRWAGGDADDGEELSFACAWLMRLMMIGVYSTRYFWRSSCSLISVSSLSPVSGFPKSTSKVTINEDCLSVRSYFEIHSAPALSLPPPLSVRGRAVRPSASSPAQRISKTTRSEADIIDARGTK